MNEVQFGRRPDVWIYLLLGLFVVMWLRTSGGMFEFGSEGVLAWGVFAGVLFLGWVVTVWKRYVVRPEGIVCETYLLGALVHRRHIPKSAIRGVSVIRQSTDWTGSTWSLHIQLQDSAKMALKSSQTEAELRLGASDVRRILGLSATEA